MLLVLIAAAVAAVMLALAPPTSAPAGATGVPTTTVSVPEPTPGAGTDDETDPDEEAPEERMAAGTAWPLKLDQRTRDQLAAAAPGTQATKVATGGTIYYGVIYGEKAPTDTYYVVALLDRLHFWTRQGNDEWRYRGGYDARVCVPPIPQRLYSAWGLTFSTKEPGTENVCAT
jgi:hypothetical protein